MNQYDGLELFGAIFVVIGHSSLYHIFIRSDSGTLTAYIMWKKLFLCHCFPPSLVMSGIAHDTFTRKTRIRQRFNSDLH